MSKIPGLHQSSSISDLGKRLLSSLLLATMHHYLLASRILVSSSLGRQGRDGKVNMFSGTMESLS